VRFDAMGLRGEARRNVVRNFVPQGTLQIIEQNRIRSVKSQGSFVSKISYSPTLVLHH